MKLKEYIESLQQFVEENPEAAELEAVYSTDDEGNGYQSVYFAPALGSYDGEYKGEWISKDCIEEDPDRDLEEYDINSVCIN